MASIFEALVGIFLGFTACLVEERALYLVMMEEDTFSFHDSFKALKQGGRINQSRLFTSNAFHLLIFF